MSVHGPGRTVEGTDSRPRWFLSALFVCAGGGGGCGAVSVGRGGRSMERQHPPGEALVANRGRQKPVVRCALDPAPLSQPAPEPLCPYAPVPRHMCSPHRRVASRRRGATSHGVGRNDQYRTAGEHMEGSSPAAAHHQQPQHRTTIDTGARTRTGTRPSYPSS